MSNDDDEKRCSECGGVHAFYLANVTPEDFERAKQVAGFIWDEEKSTTIACLIGALLLKRAALALKIPRDGLGTFVGLYLRAVREIIAHRRNAARAEKELN